MELPRWVYADGNSRRNLSLQLRNSMLRERSLARPNHRTEKFSFAELFAGIGGFHQGLRSLGGNCVFANEWDLYAAATYWTWTGNEAIDISDIRDVKDFDVLGKYDILCAGFPCQPFSLAGVSKKNSLGRPHGFGDERQGNLFFSVIDALRANQPKIVLLENVKNLASHDNGRTMKRILEELDAAGYWIQYEVIDASGWVPQSRKRIFFVGFRKNHFSEDRASQFRFPIPPKNGPLLGSILEKNVNSKFVISDNLWEYLKEYKAKHEAKGNGFGFGLVGSGDIARTMSARYHKDGAEILIRRGNRGNPRRLTPREACLLMGFDDNFARQAGFAKGFPIVVSDTQAYRQFGNSVSPLVVKAIGQEILKFLY